MIPAPNWGHVEPPLRTASVGIQLLVLGWAIEIWADTPEGWLIGVPLLVEVAISPWAFQGGPQFPPRLLLIPAISYAAAAALLTETEMLPAGGILRFGVAFAGFWVILWGTGWLIIRPVTEAAALSIARSARGRRWIWRRIQRWVGRAERDDAPNGDSRSERNLRTRAEQGDAGAQNVLGFMYSHGRGVPQDDHEAVRWYQLAADQGHAAAQFNLGLNSPWRNPASHRDKRGARLTRREEGAYRPCATDEQRSSAGMRCPSNAAGISPRAVKHVNGKGTPRDARAAVRCWRLAADQGHATAQNNLGSMYANGEGVPQDSRAAVRWFRLAADQGFAEAQFNLGVVHNDGDGVQQDSRAAVRWFRLAADQGHARAQAALERLEAR